MKPRCRWRTSSAEQDPTSRPQSNGHSRQRLCNRCLVAATHLTTTTTPTLTRASAPPKIDDCDYVFPSRAKTPFSGFGKSKAALDKAVLAAMNRQAKKGAKVEPLPNWTLHDLRRTAKTLMVRAGVRPDISERVLGHIIAGVEGTYDRHSYADEKRDALEKLAAMIDRILNPLPPTVAVISDTAYEGRGQRTAP